MLVPVVSPNFNAAACALSNITFNAISAAPNAARGATIAPSGDPIIGATIDAKPTIGMRVCATSPVFPGAILSAPIAILAPIIAPPARCPICLPLSRLCSFAAFFASLGVWTGGTRVRFISLFIFAVSRALFIV